MAPPRTLPKRPRAILFDWDNTLVDSWPTIHQALNAVMAAMGREPWSLCETREKVRLSLTQSFPLHFGERWREARRIYLETYRAIHLERLTPLPERSDLLRSLAGAGIFLAVVSNKTGAVLRAEAAAIGWSGLFGSIVGAGDAAADKPDRAPVGLALLPSGIASGEEVWLVGDTAIDVETALNSGCVPIVLRNGMPDGEFACYAPHYVFEDGAALFRFVEGL